MQLNFDASQVEPSAPMEPIPAGWYTMQVDGSEIKPLKDDKPGKRLVLDLKVVEGEYSGRHVFWGLNIENQSVAAQEIAQQQLSALCHAIQVIRLTDTNELHGKPFLAKVSLKKATDDYEANNDVKGVKPLGDGAAGPARPAGTGSQFPAWATNKAPAPAAKPATTPKPATPAPVAQPKPTPAPAPQPSPKPAAPTPKSSPAKPTPKPAPAPERKFWVCGENDPEPSEMTEEQARQYFAEPANADDQVCLDGTEEWKSAADFGLLPEPTPEPAPEPTQEAPKGPIAPPWAKKKA